MKIHHLNCTTMCPVGGRLMDGQPSRFPKRAELVCHCMAIEIGDGLVLIDTGFGLRDVAWPSERLSPFFRAMCRPQLSEEMTAIRQIEALGFQANDVRHILLTHLDFDHAGGIDDFPDAQVHLLAAEREAALHPRSFIDHGRYSAEQLTGAPNWNTYAAEGERWFGFDAVRQLRGLPPELLFVPLPGHTEGHSGIAIDDGHGWLLHAGDAYFYRHEMDAGGRRCTPGLRGYQTMMEKSRRLRLQNQERLRELARNHGDEVHIFCAHDPVELAALQLASEYLETRPEAPPSAEEAFTSPTH